MATASPTDLDVDDLDAALQSALQSSVQFQTNVTMLIIMALVVGSIFTSLLLKRFHQIHRFCNEYTVSVLLGLVVGLIIMGARWGLDTSAISLSPTVFWNLLVPPIIFEAGFNMSKSLFFKNFSSIVFLGFFGTIVAAVATAGVLYGVMAAVDPMPFLECMTFGSLISATDPATILATITGIPVNPNLGMIIFGESALNNAVALILYRATATFAASDAAFTTSRFFATMGIVLWMFVASLLIGLGCALLISFALRHINIGAHGWVLETAMMLIFAYSSYLLAELVRYSGIVAILFCGMAMATYLYPNLSQKSQESSRAVIRVFAFICQTALFLYLGLGVGAFKPTQRTFDVAYIFAGFLAVLVARLHVFVLLPIPNLWKRASRSTFKHIFFVFVSGLRGGIAFVMAVDLGANPNYSAEFRRSTLGTTIIIVVCTVVAMGTLAPLLIRGLRLEADHEAQLLGDTDDDARDFRAQQKAMAGHDDSLDEPAQKTNRLQLRRRDLLNFDKKFIRPFFTRDAGPAASDSRSVSTAPTVSRNLFVAPSDAKPADDEGETELSERTAPLASTM